MVFGDREDKGTSPVRLFWKEDDSWLLFQMEAFKNSAQWVETQAPFESRGNWKRKQQDGWEINSSTLASQSVWEPSQVSESQVWLWERWSSCHFFHLWVEWGAAGSKANSNQTENCRFGHKLRSQTAWAWIHAPSFVTLGNSSNVLVPQFPHLSGEDW